MRIKVKVKPNSKEQSVEEKEGYYLVNLKKPAQGGKANIKLLKVLKKYFKKDVKIKSGLKSRRKVIEIHKD